MGLDSLVNHLWPWNQMFRPQVSYQMFESNHAEQNYQSRSPFNSVRLHRGRNSHENYLIEIQLELETSDVLFRDPRK